MARQCIGEWERLPRPLRGSRAASRCWLTRSRFLISKLTQIMAIMGQPWLNGEIAGALNNRNLYMDVTANRSRMFECYTELVYAHSWA